VSNRPSSNHYSRVARNDLGRGVLEADPTFHVDGSGLAKGVPPLIRFSQGTGLSKLGFPGLIDLGLGVLEADPHRAS